MLLLLFEEGERVLFRLMCCFVVMRKICGLFLGGVGGVGGRPSIGSSVISDSNSSIGGWVRTKSVWLAGWNFTSYLPVFFLFGLIRRHTRILFVIFIQNSVYERRKKITNRMKIRNTDIRISDIDALRVFASVYGMYSA